MRVLILALLTASAFQAEASVNEEREARLLQVNERAHAPTSAPAYRRRSRLKCEQEISSVEVWSIDYGNGDYCSCYNRHFVCMY